MTVGQWLQQAKTQLQTAGIETARLDSLVLLEDCSGLDRGYLLAHPELELTPEKIAVLESLLTRRTQHMPLAYLRGKAEFYGREFVVGPGVLVPRPESETIIGSLKQLFEQFALDGLQPPDGKGWRIADVGAGCGCLGITAALELPEARVELLEFDRSAIEVARLNVINFATSVLITASDLLSGANHGYDILLCNLPYVPDEYTINRAATNEPAIAIFGGLDGLDLYRSLFHQINSLNSKPLYILAESLPLSHSALSSIANSSGYKLQETVDFIQIFALSQWIHI